VNVNVMYSTLSLYYIEIIILLEFSDYENHFLQLIEEITYQINFFSFFFGERKKKYFLCAAYQIFK
jgi:hypothetical protein